MRGLSPMLFLLCCLFGMPLLSSTADAACTSSAREVAVGAGSTRLKAYSCATSDGGAPVVQVEFDRLSEAVAGDLLEGALDQDLRKVYGAVTVLHNKVYREAKSLYDSYGVRMLGQNCFALNLTSAEKGTAKVAPRDDGTGGCGQKRVMWYLTFPDMENLTTKDYPASWKPRVAGRDWPAGWRFYYAAPLDHPDGAALMSSTYLWRPLQAADLAHFKRDIAASEARIGSPLGVEDGQMEARSDPANERYFLMVDHISRGSLPDDFLTIVVADPASCGCGAEGDGIHIRQLVLHTAFVRNVSDAPLAIDGLLQGEDDSELLRPYSDGQAPAAVRNETVGPVMLRPGETLAIPLRIKFVPADSLNLVFRAPAAAERVFRQIQAFPAEVLTSGTDCAHKYTIRRESFGPPTAPSPRLYSYGPAVTLKGLSLAGQPIAFDNPLSNFLQLVAGSGYGSCPYLYVYDDGERDWVNHGKIIDNASSPAKQTTQRLSIAGLATRFRISEEELELTYIKSVALELTLADGRILTLAPTSGGHTPDGFDRIKYGASRDYAFSVPFDDRALVERSTFVVTGYYIRYTDLDAVADVAASH